LVIFNSCSHNGIYNSIASVKNIFKGKKIRSYIGGLHYTNPFTKQHENTIELDTLIDFVKTEGIKLYSGHCTGKYCIKYLKKELGDKFVTIATGSELFV
ncbi:MAG TPA: MBL fold metallo-hydrolase, partial [Spirochaetota bacterium]|nr:MBL fold metallo-hydrolase [Spirochaetota bacterium]